MKRIVLLLLMMGSFVIVEAQNVVYDENAEVRKLDNFNSIELSGTVSLYLSQGSVAGVAVSAGEEKYNSKIKTEVKNGVLRISVEGGVWNGFNWTSRKLKAYVTAPDLNRLDVSGASYVSIAGTFKSEELRIEVSGASEIKGIVDANKLNVSISGASEAKLTGTVKEGQINASGAAKIGTYGLLIDNCKVSSSGASNIRITVNGQLNADASGGSAIYYKGTAVGKVLNASAGATIKNRSGNDD